ncbi:maltose/maltodextrin ABC transporter substrate-binding protein MalE [Photobacterium rosenbergii]|uniref:Maltodextrin-binding protein n=1 Tax=Photobacterium rosenbergii TaxID=294936 RepID=A0A2T3N722_9GAMM|nr:maltose/maltodextrin ABC transporter substrate-binding protein MalE [Photobacterium rosenbergii]PSW08689.1 maltose/maltodextrin ABC transporter substrate-binding protein MalE [Photobacterium rosenbergii]
MKNKTILSLAVSCAIASFNAAAFSDSELTVWMPLDKGQKGMTYAVEKFEEEMGIKVNVEFPVQLEERFTQVASVGKGPDIMIFAHDRFGGYAEAGFVKEIRPSESFKEKFAPYTWEAMSYKSKIYGYPIAAESLSLIYNKDVIKEPLENWEDIYKVDEELRKQGKKAIAWDLRNPYFTHPLFSSAGAYTFELTPEGFNPNNTGVNTPEAKRTMQFLKDIVDKDIISRDMDYSRAEAAFINGEVAYTINGPWSWANIDKLGVNYGIAELPKFEGKPSRPFVGILMAGINTSTPNADIAAEFIENYLLSKESLEYMNSQVPIGVPALNAFSEELANDPRIEASLINANNGDVMPNIPQLLGYWNGMTDAIANILEERESIEKSLQRLETRVLANAEKTEN